MQTLLNKSLANSNTNIALKRFFKKKKKQEKQENQL